MSSGKVDGSGPMAEALEQELERGAQQADPVEVAAVDTRLEALMDQVADPPVSQQASPQPSAVSSGALAPAAMRTAVPLGVRGRVVQLRVRGMPEEVTGELAPGVSRELIQQAAKNRDAVVLECLPDAPPLVVGVLQRTIPQELTIKASKLHIEGEQEVLLRSGRGAMRIRQDGDIEIVGSRIAAMSRGLFRLVGRVLRLN